jgi:hypothetical protein
MRGLISYKSVVLSLRVVLCLLRRMTTNQKVAGSSPAERATKCPAKRKKIKALGGDPGGFWQQ